MNRQRVASHRQWVGLKAPKSVVSEILCLTPLQNVGTTLVDRPTVEMVLGQEQSDT